MLRKHNCQENKQEQFIPDTISSASASSDEPVKTVSANCWDTSRPSSEHTDTLLASSGVAAAPSSAAQNICTVTAFYRCHSITNNMKKDIYSVHITATISCMHIIRWMQYALRHYDLLQQLLMATSSISLQYICNHCFANSCFILAMIRSETGKKERQRLLYVIWLLLCTVYITTSQSVSTA